MPEWARNSVGTEHDDQILPYGSLLVVCQSSMKACLGSRGRVKQCFAVTLWRQRPDWFLSNQQRPIDFLSAEPTRCPRHLLTASWWTVMPANQQLTQTDANALCWRGWVTHAQIDPTLRDIGSCTMWVPLYCHSESYLIHVVCHRWGLGLLCCFVTIMQAGQVYNRKINSTQAVQSCISCNKKSTAKANYHCDLQANQHSLCVVISICRESASVSSFPVAVTCSGLRLTASCHHCQFIQCRRLWGVKPVCGTEETRKTV